MVAESTGASTPAKAVVLAAVIDVVFVVGFTLVGRASHNEGPAGLLVTAWPFLGGLAIGWLLMRAWRHPRRIFWAGIGIWIATVAGGMLLRVISGQGTAIAFIIVATVALGVLLIGWRAIVGLVLRNR